MGLRRLAPAELIMAAECSLSRVILAVKETRDREDAAAGKRQNRQI